MNKAALLMNSGQQKVRGWDIHVARLSGSTCYGYSNGSGFMEVSGGILRGDLFGHANLELSVYDDGRSNLRDSDVRKSERVERHASRYGRNHSDGEYLPLHSAGIFQRFGRGQNYSRRDRRVNQISLHKKPISQCAYAAC